LYIIGINCIIIRVLYPICTSRNEVQILEIYYFVLQHSATYSNTLATFCNLFCEL